MDDILRSSDNTGQFVLTTYVKQQLQRFKTHIRNVLLKMLNQSSKINVSHNF